jgi:hypothetical protein
MVDVGDMDITANKNSNEYIVAGEIFSGFLAAHGSEMITPPPHLLGS